MHPYDTQRESEKGAARTLPALVLVGIGALFLLNNLHIVGFQDWFKYWPTILIAAGIVKLVDSTDIGARVLGGMLLGVGGILLARNLGWLEVRLRDLWPIFLIGVGVWLLFQRLPWMEKGLPSGPATEDAGVLNEAAIFGGGRRVVTTQAFQGGQLTAIFGGFEVDLRGAGMAGDTAVLEINTIFGGAEVKVPRRWSAVVQGTGIFGGYSDESLQPEVVGADTKRLIIKGAAIFGAVNVKN